MIEMAFYIELFVVLFWVLLMIFYPVKETEEKLDFKSEVEKHKDFLDKN